MAIEVGKRVYHRRMELYGEVKSDGEYGIVPGDVGNESVWVKYELPWDQSALPARVKKVDLVEVDVAGDSVPAPVAAPGAGPGEAEVVVPRRLLQWVLNDLARHDEDYHHRTPARLPQAIRALLEPPFVYPMSGTGVTAPPWPITIVDLPGPDVRLPISAVQPAPAVPGGRPWDSPVEELDALVEQWKIAWGEVHGFLERTSPRHVPNYAQRLREVASEANRQAVAVLRG